MSYAGAPADWHHPRTPRGALVRAFGRPLPEVQDILGPGGALSKALPGYQPRETQIALSEAVLRCFRLREHGLFQGETGTGKSFAALIPAILMAQEGKKVTVYATGNKALQDQLRTKDLPFLQKTLGDRFPFRWTVLKGRQNYACLAQGGGQLPLELDKYAEAVAQWLNVTSTGDLGELPFDLTSKAMGPLRRDLTVSDDDCPGRNRCPLGDDCWFYQARDRAQDLAETGGILVTNHALLMLDLVLGGMILPPYDFLILDEVHQLEEYARGALERILTHGRVAEILGKVGRLGAGYLEEPNHACKVRTANFFGELDRYLDSKNLRRFPGDVALNATHLPADLMQAADDLSAGLLDLCLNLRQFVESDPQGENAGRGIRLHDESARLAKDLSSLKEEGPNRVLHAEVSPKKATALKITPVEVGPFLKANLFNRIPRVPVVCMSATLATGPKDDPDAFEFIRKRLGIESATTGRYDSPFNWARQALYYLPPVAESPQAQGKEKPHEAAARYARGIAPHIQEILLATQGRAFVLFTSYAVLRATRPLVDLPCPIRCQGDEDDDALSKTGLVEWFKSTPNAVLFGVSSFWEGVDVPGQALSCVIIDKIPFPNGGDPVENARRTRMGMGAYFQTQAIPAATTKLVQGVGRLIRTETDRGLVVLLDPRFTRMAYGPRILAALPGAPVPDIPEADCPTTLVREDLPFLCQFIDGGK